MVVVVAMVIGDRRMTCLFPQAAGSKENKGDEKAEPEVASRKPDETKTQPKLEPEVQPKLEPEVQPEPTRKPDETKTQPKLEPEVQPKLEPEVQPKPTRKPNDTKTQPVATTTSIATTQDIKQKLAQGKKPIGREALI